MKQKILLTACVIFLTLSCTNNRLVQNSIESSMKGMQTYIQGENISLDDLFYPNAVYYNGKAQSGNTALDALKKDFSGLQSFTLKSMHRGMQKNHQITVHGALCGNGKDIALITAWQKLGGNWTILFMAKGDSLIKEDPLYYMKPFEKTFNRRIVKDLVDRFYDDKVCFVQGTTTFYGRDAAIKGLAFLENNRGIKNGFTVFEQFSLGKDLLITVGEITANDTVITFPYIFIWRTAGAGKRLVVEFDYI